MIAHQVNCLADCEVFDLFVKLLGQLVKHTDLKSMANVVLFLKTLVVYILYFQRQMELVLVVLILENLLPMLLSSCVPIVSRQLLELFLFQCCFAFPIPSPLMTFWFLNILFARCCSYALSFFGP